MKKLNTFIVSSLIIFFTNTSFAVTNQIMEEFYKTSNSPLVFSPLAISVKNNQHEIDYTLACFGCNSEITGRPRTEYVRPHYRSNGTWVDGYYRS